jgi:hypothetical protein
MRLRNYCVVIMGDTKDVFLEIEKVSEDKPNVLDAKGIVIATFLSTLKINELNEWFKLHNRSYFVFDLSISGFNITKKEIHDGLFGFLADKSILDKRASDLMSAIEDAKIIQENSKKVKIDKPIDVKTEIRPKRLSLSDIESMTNKEKEELMNNIIDKGVENLTEYDKKLLPLLVK